jgi:hypothetical protein
MKDTITALYLKIGNNLKPAISGVISGLRRLSLFLRLLIG